MTSYPITMPTSPGIRSANWGLRFNTNMHVSPANRAQQAVRNIGGEQWMGNIAHPPMSAVNKAVLMAALNSLEGMWGSFYQGDPAYTAARGTAGGTPLVNGASQTGNTLVTDGWSAGATLLKGDYFQIGDHLYQQTVDSTADGSGNMTLTFVPRLRSSPADNLALTISAPKCAMRLTEDGVMVQEDVNGWFHISYDAVEVLP